MEFLETNNLIDIAQKIKASSLTALKNTQDIKIYLDTKKNLETKLDSLKMGIQKQSYENTELKNKETRDIAIKEAISKSEEIATLVVALKVIDSKINDLEVKNLCEEIEIKFLQNLLRIAEIESYKQKVGV